MRRPPNRGGDLAPPLPPHVFLQHPRFDGTEIKKEGGAGSGALTNRGLTGARYSGMAAVDRVRLGKRTGGAAASETKEMSRTDGGKSDKRLVRRCHGRARRAIEPRPRDLQPHERPPQIVVPIRWGTGSSATPEPHATARSDGEHRQGNKTSVQERWESKTLM